MTNMPRGFRFGELGVEATQNLGGVDDVPSERTQDRHGDGHEQRGWDPLPRHVAQCDDEAVVGRAENFIEVAANLLCRLDDRVHVQIGVAGCRLEIGGQDAHLDLAGDSQVAGHRLANGVGIRLGLEQRPDASLDLEHLERLRQVVVAADLEPAGLVLDVLERAQEHDRQLARRLLRAKLAADFVAVDARHHDVEEHEIRRALLDAAKSGRAIERDAQLVLAAQRLDQDVDIRLRVIDDENAALGQILHVSGSQAEVSSACFNRAWASANA